MCIENYKQLITNSGHELECFLNENSEFKISSINSDLNFSGKINKIDDGEYKIFSMITNFTAIVCEYLRDCICFMYSRNSFSCTLNKSYAEFPSGGVVIFKEKDVIEFNANRDVELILCIIPYGYHGRDAVTNKIDNNFDIYADCIIEIMTSIFSSNLNLILKINTIRSLVSLAIPELFIITNDGKAFIKLLDFIKSNSLNSDINVDYVSTSLCMSKSKMHKLLKKNGTSYSYIVEYERVNQLLQRIEHDCDSSICKLCFDCGFNSTAHANVIFKKYNNISILNFKKQIRKNYLAL